MCKRAFSILAIYIITPFLMLYCVVFCISVKPLSINEKFHKVEALRAQARHNLDGYPAWFQHRSMNMTKKTEVRTKDCHISSQTRRRRSQKSWVLIWDKCAERCRQRGRKGRYNYVIREGGSRIGRRLEEGVHISVSAPVRLRQVGCSTDTAYHLMDGELHSFVCLRKHAAPWVWREWIGTKKAEASCTFTMRRLTT